MTKIIGHRGAAGVALENSLAGIKAAIRSGADAVEFDVRTTSDGELVLVHSAFTWRVSYKILSVADSTLHDLQSLPLKNGERILTLDEALSFIGDALPVMIDLKSPGVTAKVLASLDAHPKVRAVCSGRQYDDLLAIREARSDLPIILQHHYDPMDIIHRARSMDASGICLNVWLMNPFTYRLAKRFGLDIYVYTVNYGWLMRFLQRLYPKVIIVTNHPDKLIALRTETTTD